MRKNIRHKNRFGIHGGWYLFIDNLFSCALLGSRGRIGKQFFLQITNGLKLQLERIHFLMQRC